MKNGDFPVRYVKLPEATVFHIIHCHPTNQCRLSTLRNRSDRWSHISQHPPPGIPSVHVPLRAWWRCPPRPSGLDQGLRWWTSSVWWHPQLARGWPNGPEGLKFWGIIHSLGDWGPGKHNKRVGVQPFELVNWSKIWGYHVPSNLHSLQISLRYPFPLQSCSSCGAEVQLLGWTCCNSCATARAIYRIRKVWVTWIQPRLVNGWGQSFHGPWNDLGCMAQSGTDWHSSPF